MIYMLTNYKPMTPAINNDISSLDPQFRKKFDLWRKEVITKYPNAVVFETKRSQLRQDWLYAQGRTRPWKIVTWTKNSNHKEWKAVDIVFRNNWKLERAWPYNDLIVMAKKYGIKNLAPKELCHFEDDWTVLLVWEKQVEKPTNISTEDTKYLLQLQEDKIRNGELGNLDQRMLVIVARIYNKLRD